MRRKRQRRCLTMRVDVGLAAIRDFSEEEWKTVDAWLEDVVNQAIQGIAVDTAVRHSGAQSGPRLPQRPAVLTAIGSIALH